MAKRRDNVSLSELHSIGRGEAGPMEEQPGEQSGNGTPTEAPPQEEVQQDGAAPAASKKCVETKAQRFRRLAEVRVQKALDRIQKLVPLGNRGQYEWGPQEADAIVGALNAATERVKRALTGGGEEKLNFRLL